ncbi:MAG: flagellar biosynthesis protein FlgG [Deltaproteobacteria bacterium]|jgi:flagellar basal-body rod protein FlgC|nr:flagellar biosynthesis protein FlgG [Deltaproteobacteria bacterium]
MSSLIGAAHASTSALYAFGVGTAVTAHNLANVLTQGFKSSRTLYSDLPQSSGVVVSTQKLYGPGPLIPNQEGLPANDSLELIGPGGAPRILLGFLEGSNTNVAVEMVNLIVASRAYQANAKVIPTVDEMLGIVINLKV